jgi:hypothetical protein
MADIARYVIVAAVTAAVLAACALPVQADEIVLVCKEHVTLTSDGNTWPETHTFRIDAAREYVREDKAFHHATVTPDSISWFGQLMTALTLDRASLHLDGSNGNGSVAITGDCAKGNNQI